MARDALIRMESRTGGAVLSVFGAHLVGRGIVRRRHRDAPGPRPAGDGEDTARARRGLLARADDLLDSGPRGGLAGELGPAALRAHHAVRAPWPPDSGPPRPASPTAIPTGRSSRQDALDRVERAWARVAAHHLAGTGDRRTSRVPRRRPAHPLARRHVVSRDVRGLPCCCAGTPTRTRGWTRRSTTLPPGSAILTWAPALSSVLAAARARRAAHDTGFAAALAALHAGRRPAGDQGVLRVEDLLRTLVMPLARLAPVLLLVLDGMSAGVGAEVVASILARPRDGWAEALLTGQSVPRRRARRAAHAHRGQPRVPAVGGLRRGGQDTERNGFAALARAHGLTDAPLFHKRPLDSARPGYAARGRRGGRHRRRHPVPARHLRAQQRSTTRSTGPTPAASPGAPTP